MSDAEAWKDPEVAAEFRRRVEAREGKAAPRAVDSADFLRRMRRRDEDLQRATEVVMGGRQCGRSEAIRKRARRRTPRVLILDHCFRHIPGLRARLWEFVRAVGQWLDEHASGKLGDIVSSYGWAAMWRQPRRRGQ